MSTHRRGVRPSQWPVRDLLGPQTGRARFWDARIGAAAAGLLACGAAVTVVLTSGGRAMSDQTLEVPGAPPPIPVPAQAPPPIRPPEPPPVAAPQGPAPHVVAPHPRSVAPQRRPAVPPHPQHRRAAPRHRTAVPAPSAHDVPAERAAPREDKALADQVAAAVEAWEGRSGQDGEVVGWLLLPVQRPADAAALLDLAGVDEPRQERGSDRRHRDRDREPRANRQAEDRVGGHRVPDGHGEDRVGRHRAPDGHGEDRMGRHRKPDHDDERPRLSSDGDQQSGDLDERGSATSRNDGERVPEDDGVSRGDRDSDDDVGWFEAA